MISPIVLEVCVVCLGIFLLMAESFSVKSNKVVLAHGAIFGLLCVFILSFFIEANPAQLQASGFYVVDGLSLFFKRFALLSTIVTLILAVDYLPVVQRLVPSVKPGAGTGEFCSPRFHLCRTDVDGIGCRFHCDFCALELVTISLYIQVAYMRRSLASLEAGTKFLILGALSTGFLFMASLGSLE